MTLPIHYRLTEILALLGNWFNGNTDKNDTYFGIRFLWLARWGSIIQFIAGLSVVIEIVGKEKVREVLQNFDALISPKNLILRMRNVFDFKSKFYTKWQVLSIVWWTGLTASIIQKSATLLAILNHTYVAKQSSNVNNSNDPTAGVIIFVIIFATIVLLFIRATRPFMRGLIQFPIVLACRLFVLLMMLIVEFSLFKPTIFYLRISTSDRNSKILSFFTLLLGFCMSLLFS